MTDFKPLLSAKTDGEDLAKLSFPFLWSPKLDGIRTLIVPERGAVTRKIKLVPNERLRAVLSVPELEGFDGEMVFGNVTDKDVFNRTQSKVMKIEGPCPYEDGGRFLVFDDFSEPELSFEERFKRLQWRVMNLSQKLQQVVHVVPHRLVDNLDDLMNIERVVVEKGYEGIMGRDPKGRYKFGRSTLRDGILIKIKRFEDDEGEIVGCYEQLHNDNVAEKDELGHTKRSKKQENMIPTGVLGGFTLKNPKYQGTFDLGGGFTAAQRADFWARRDELIGKTVCFKFQPSGMKDKPRFLTFKGFRKD